MYFRLFHMIYPALRYALIALFWIVVLVVSLQHSRDIINPPDKFPFRGRKGKGRLGYEEFYERVFLCAGFDDWD